MSVTRHHADWLSLVEVSGPFVSLPVLQKVFPQGLEGRDPAQAKLLRAAYEEWQDNPTAPGKQRAWVMHVLASVLGYPENQIAEGQTLPAGLQANMPEMGETLRPDFALIAPTGTEMAGQPQLLIASYPAEQSLDKPVIGKHWKATPATRMMELLHGANVPLGLVTNGEHWMLVYAPRGETTGYASWYGSLWLDEPITLRAFHSLLGVRRFFGVAADSTLLALLKESANDQQEVTDQLGYQVREAVEVLVQSFDALDKENNRTLLKGIKPANLYDSALTVMMRLVFLFSAEERGLLHLGKPLYDDNYAVSTLQEQLQEVADRYGEEVLERRYDAWARLLATFRAVHGGIQHQDLLMQAYGGSLFDPDRYPFLEGRAAGSQWRSTPAEPLSVNNRVVLHLLNSLQRLRTKVGAGTTAETRRVSFRALGVEQIGHVYEGLLDHTAFRADEEMLGIRGTRSKEPEIALATLESLLAQDEDKLIEHLKEETGRSVSALRKELNNGDLLDEHKLLIACDQDEALLARLRPFAGLIRNDSFDRPWVVLPGSVFVTAGTARRSTGTHYTPPSLTEPIVQHTLEPLVYIGPAEGLPKEQWKLKSPKEILDLKVCDMAMGSGAFLVQACRYLAERLVEAWENEEKAHPGQVLITPDGKFSQGSPSERLVPAEAAERIAIARRVVADRCLYGVDINPMAVEMAKLSMWLITVDANRPFTFLDHAFKCGDSLLGITTLDQLENFSLRPGGGKQQAFATLNLWRHIEEAKKKREVLETMPSDTPDQIEAKAALYAEAEESVAKLHAAADILMALELTGLTGRAYEAEREISADRMMAYWAADLNELQKYARQKAGKHQFLHWALAFPEIVGRKGFDAFVGNPPFQGGTKISSYLGRDYLKSLVANYEETGDRTDLIAYFVRRASTILARAGYLGYVVSNAIVEGDTRKAALDYLIARGVSPYRATSQFLWPGTAGVRIILMWLSRAAWNGDIFFNKKKVASIGSNLSDELNLADTKVLSSRPFFCGIGAKPYGEGFVVTKERSLQLIGRNSNLSKCLFPFFNGADLNANSPPVDSRWIINFGTSALEQAETFKECMDIVREKVYPERIKDSDKVRRTYWWQFERHARELYDKLPSISFAFARSYASRAHLILPVEIGPIYSANVVVFCTESWGDFAVLQSSIHGEWFYAKGASMPSGNRMYVPSECFDTFPWPTSTSAAMSLGKRFNDHRSAIFSSGIGPNKLQHQFDNPKDQNSQVDTLRALLREMDVAVMNLWGWDDVQLGHGFHETKQGIRFTISGEARREIFNRLLTLNHQRYAEEKAQKAALPTSASAKRGRKPKVSSGQATMDF